MSEIHKYKQMKILLYDGDCSVCNKSVQFVLKWNSKSNIYFASLQSDIGVRILSQFQLAINELSTVVFIDNNRAFIKSDAALQIAKYLDKPINYLQILKLVPKMLRDFVYDFIAKHRYKIMKKKEFCIMPTPEIKSRFLS